MEQQEESCILGVLSVSISPKMQQHYPKNAIFQRRIPIWSFTVHHHHKNCCCWSLKWYFLTKWHSVQCRVEVRIMSTIFLQMLLLLLALHSKKTNFRRAELQLELDFGRNGSCDFSSTTNYTRLWISNWSNMSLKCLFTVYGKPYSHKRKLAGRCQRVKDVSGNTVNHITSVHDS